MAETPLFDPALVADVIAKLQSGQNVQVASALAQVLSNGLVVKIAAIEREQAQLTAQITNFTAIIAELNAEKLALLTPKPTPTPAPSS